jgi:hypothetical protein
MISKGLLIACAAVAGLAACGGGRSADVTVSTISNLYSTGPIQRACMRADRRAANRALCGCVQSAANSVLSNKEQSRAAKFFKDPHHAQEVRQSDRTRDEAFWQRYKQFVSVAERSCR